MAFFNIPQNLKEEDQGFQGALSYQKNNISFSFLLEGMKAFNEVTYSSIPSKYTILYIMTNKKRYTIYNSIRRESFSFSLGHPTTLTLQYEWLFDDWIDPKSIKGEHLICRTNYLEFFFTTNKHLFIDFDDQNIEENQESYTKKSFWIQKNFLSEKFENDKIKARHSSRISQGQHRLFSCQ